MSLLSRVYAVIRILNQRTLIQNHMSNTSTFEDYQSKIISFNADADVIRLREHYNETSFFEIISKERSETTYSSFLKWVFKECSTNVGELMPVLLLLDILVKKDVNSQFDKSLKTALLSRSVKEIGRAHV